MSDSTVVITGASSGLGAATALTLARRGARVVLAARNEEALADLAHRCEKVGAESLVVPTDVSDDGAVQRLAGAAEARFGRIDAWINNAGVAAFGRLVDLPAEDLRRTIEVDLLGYVHGARAAAPRLQAAGGGVLVMVLSALSEVPAPYLGSYTIAKHGALGLCDTLRQELRSSGLRDVSVCTVLPNSIDTPFFARAGNYTGRALRPMPPVDSPQRVAERVVRLLESPRRQTRLGLGATMLNWQWRLMPGLTEQLLNWYGRRAQFRGDEPAVATPGNVFHPLEAPMRVEGGWRRPGDSLWTRLVDLTVDAAGRVKQVIRPRAGSQSQVDRSGRGEATLRGDTGLSTAHTERTIEATPQQVFEVLKDGWTYSDWVVGTVHIRDVDPDWPQPDARIHHKFMPWPLSLPDETRVVRCEPPTRLVLQPQLRPFGEVTVTLTLAPAGNGSTRVSIREDISGGPMATLRSRVSGMLLHSRNRETLRRLADLVEHRNGARRARSGRQPQTTGRG